MASELIVTPLVEGDRIAVYKLDIIGDTTSDLSDEEVVDFGDQEMRLMRVRGAIGGFTASLAFGDDADILAAVLADDANIDLDLRDVGGITNTGAPENSLVINTTGLTVNEGGSLIVELRKKGASPVQLNEFFPATLDNTPSPSGTVADEDQALVGVATDRVGGTLYIVVTETDISGGDMPTAEQIRAGLEAPGDPADFAAHVPVTNLSPSILFTGLESDTTYFYAMVQYSPVEDYPSNVVGGTFTTDDGEV